MRGGVEEAPCPSGGGAGGDEGGLRGRSEDVPVGARGFVRDPACAWACTKRAMSMMPTWGGQPAVQVAPSSGRGEQNTAQPALRLN